MCREAIALSICQHRPGYEERIAVLRDVEEEVRVFAPRLLVHTDADGLDPGVPRGVLCRIEVPFSEGMSTRISVDGRVEESLDISTDVLLRVADEAAAGMREP